MPEMLKNSKKFVNPREENIPHAKKNKNHFYCKYDGREQQKIREKENKTFSHTSMTITYHKPSPYKQE
jgi:hypothetical protein